MIDYLITPHPDTHLLRIELTIPFPEGHAETVFRLPVWTLGSYVERSFSGRIRSVAARDAAGHPVPIEWAEPSLWRLGRPSDGMSGSVTLTYEAFAYSLGIHDAYIDGKRGFFNPSAVLLLPDGCENEPVRIAFAKDWRAFCALGSDSEGRLTARNRQELLDSPVTLLPEPTSDAVTFTVTAYGIPHDVVVTGTDSLSTERLTEDLRRIFETCIAFWDPEGKRPPFRRYLMQLHLSPRRYGGLEHADGCVLLEDIHALPAQGETEPPENYSEFLTLVAHEYFHAWLVRRLRPQAVVETDQSAPILTNDLWIFEGFTSLYESRLLRLAGLFTEEEYRSAVAKRLNAAWGREGFDAMSLERSSRLAWVKLYRPTEDSPFSAVSYYAKGALAALLLDDEIRRRTLGADSLDSILSRWWLRDRAAIADGTYPGLPDRGFGALLSELTGYDFGDFLSALTVCEGNRHFWAERLDSCLRSLGWKRIPDTKAPSPLRLAGLTFRSGPTLTVDRILLGSPSQRCGLFTGDELVAVDGLRADPRDADRLIERCRNRSVPIAWFREDRLLTGTLDLSDPLGDWQRLLPFRLEADAGA